MAPDLTFCALPAPAARRAPRRAAHCPPRCAQRDERTEPARRPFYPSAAPAAAAGLGGCVPESVVLRGGGHDGALLAAARRVEAGGDAVARIALLRRRKVALLVDDVACQMRAAEHGGALGALAARADALAAALVALPAGADDTALRAALRALLWQARVALAPLAPAAHTRAALERARGALLDVARPAAPAAAAPPALRAEVYALLVENALLEELRSVRVLERGVRAAAADAAPALDGAGRARLAGAARALAAAAAGLGIDDYRVRGKTRVVAAVDAVRDAVPPGGDAVRAACARLRRALVESLATDLALRRPAGQAMLLRPAMHDIPNFEVVARHMVRGGQPTTQGMDWLVHYGVSTVVDLRGSDRENQWAGPRHAAAGGVVGGGGGGLTVRNVEIEDFGTPSLRQVDEFVDIVDRVRDEGGVCFVHCKAGIGRTGVMVSCWRIRQGESADEALRKERLYSPGAGGGLKQEDFVRQYADFFANGG